MAITDYLIPIKSGINDAPQPPTATKGSNGSYLIAQYNALLTFVSNTFNAIAADISTLKTSDTTITSSITSAVARIATIEAKPLPKDWTTDIAALTTRIATLETGLASANAAIAAIPASDGSGAGGGNVDSSLILPDTFNATDGTTLIGKKPSANGSPWVKYLPNSSDGEIVSNALTQGVSNLFAMRSHSSNTYVYTVTFKGTASSSAEALSLYVRGATDGSNKALILKFGFGAFTIYNHSGSSNYALLYTTSFSGFSTTNWTTITAEVDPSGVTVSVGNEITWDLGNADYAAQTGIGLGVQGANYQIDSISVV